MILRRITDTSRFLTPPGTCFRDEQRNGGCNVAARACLQTSSRFCFINDPLWCRICVDRAKAYFHASLTIGLLFYNVLFILAEEAAAAVPAYDNDGT
ncbi:hypothetical protein Zmor_004612 [Zophobas morio]|uniref:Uncharacterized protein n=1 Tax=Zophobas morio TaxID=2755281 RepID=A0AA38MLF3_9CUCU|nr:hypothetical protein Zmor_004612 [Zophobas morio]